MGTYARNPVEFVRGEGSRLWDADGNEYLDFLAGISVVQIGHCHPALVEAVTEQAGAADARRQPLLHGARDPARRAAVELSLGGKVFFGNSGAEANECAIKLARRHRRRRRHRRLRGRLPRPHHGRAVGDPAGGQAGAVRAARARLHGRCRGTTPMRSRAAVDRARRPPCCSSRSRGSPASTRSTAEKLRPPASACDEHGALLIFDEIQCGMGRTRRHVGVGGRRVGPT